MLHFHVDPHSGLPVYRQLMDQIKYYVASGVLGADQLLPSIRQLAKTLRVNPSTVVKAYSELEHEKVIAMRHGQGAYVCGKNKAIGDHERERLLRKLMQPVAVQALQLDATPAAAVRALRDEIERLLRERGEADA